MNVDDVDDEPMLRAQGGNGRLRQEQRCLQIAAHEVIPLGLRYRAHGGGIESRRVVDEHVEPSEFAQGGRDQGVGYVGIEKIGAVNGSRPRPQLIEFGGQRSGRGVRVPVMNEQTGSLSVQRARDVGTHAPCGPGDEDHVVGQRRDLGAGCHGTERYRIAPAACTRA